MCTVFFVWELPALHTYYVVWRNRIDRAAYGYSGYIPPETRLVFLGSQIQSPKLGVLSTPPIGEIKEFENYFVKVVLREVVRDRYIRFLSSLMLIKWFWFFDKSTL